MEAVKQYVGGGVFFGVLVLVLGFVSPTSVRAVAEKITTVFVTNDAANPVPVNVVNRPPSQFVTLVRLGPFNEGYRQQFANGDTDSQQFSIPAGFVLVITDIDVVFRRIPADAGKSGTYFLTSTDAASGTVTRARLMTTLNSEGEGIDGQHLQTGIVIVSTSTLGDTIPDSSFDVATLRGYLAADQ